MRNDDKVLYSGSGIISKNVCVNIECTPCGLLYLLITSKKKLEKRKKKRERLWPVRIIPLSGYNDMNIKVSATILLICFVLLVVKVLTDNISIDVFCSVWFRAYRPMKCMNGMNGHGQTYTKIPSNIQATTMLVSSLY